MPVFSYTAKSFDGERYAGVLTAESQRDVIAYIKQNKGIPISILRSKEHGTGLRLFYALFCVARLREWSVWCLSLSRLLAAGIPVLRALRLLARQIRSPTVWRAFDDVIADVTAGASLSSAFKSRGAAIPDLVQVMAAAGEQSGQLEEMLDTLGRFLQRQEAFRRRVRGVLAYPVVLLGAGLVATGVFQLVVLPRFDQLYASFSVQRPAFSGLALAPFVAVAVGCCSWQLLYQPFQLWKKVQLALFCRTMSFLLQAGVNYLDAVSLACRTIRFFPGCQQHSESLVAGLAQGRLLSDLLQEWRALFDPVTIGILQAGEESGRFDMAFALGAEQAEASAEQLAENWVLWSQPMFILLMTGLTGGLLYRFIMPLFQLAIALPEQL